MSPLEPSHPLPRDDYYEQCWVRIILHICDNTISKNGVQYDSTLLCDLESFCY